MNGHTVTKHQQAEDDSKLTTGFWIYLMTDCVLFASLFATYAVLRNNTWGGPSGAEVFNLPLILVATLLLLTSSFTCGMAVLAAKHRDKNTLLMWLGLTLLLGLGFLGIELTEFSQLIAEGNSWRVSGFLSAFFTLVATHGLHISVGLLWLLILAIYIVRRGLTEIVVKRLTIFSLFWHFLDIIWIFIFTIVYMMGKA